MFFALAPVRVPVPAISSVAVKTTSSDMVEAPVMVMSAAEVSARLTFIALASPALLLRVTVFRVMSPVEREISTVCI